MPPPLPEGPPPANVSRRGISARFPSLRFFAGNSHQGGGEGGDPARPLPPPGSTGEPRSRWPSLRLFANGRGHSRSHGSNGSAVPPPDGVENQRHPNRMSYMPHLHLPHRGSVSLFGGHHDPNTPHEFHFEDEGASSEESDSEDSTFSESLDSTSKSSQEGKLLRKIRGGIHGAGAATMHALDRRRVPQRILTGFFAVCLLWITSYGVARAIVNSAIVIPDLDNVADYNVAAYQASKSERARYVVCVNEVADDCERDYNIEREEEINRRDAEREENRQVLLDLAANVTLAEVLFNETQTELDFLVKNGTLDLSLFRTGSNSSNCDVIDGVVAGQNAAINALVSARKFQAKANGQALTLAQQLKRRQLYDDEYIANKTAELIQLGVTLQSNVYDFTTGFTSINGTINQFDQCMKVGGSCPNQPVFESLQDMYTESTGIFTSLQDAADEYKTLAEAEMDEYSQTITTFRNNLQFIQDLFGSAITNIPNSNDASKPPFNPNLFSLAGIDDPADIIDSYPGLFSELQTDMGALQSSYEGGASSLQAASGNVHVGWNSDYDPPEFDPLNSTSDFQNDTTTFISDLATILGGNQDGGDIAQDAASGDVNATAGALNATAQELFAQLTNHSAWDFYAYPTSVYDEVNSGLTRMSDLVLGFDLAFRVIYTIIIMRKYWNLTALATPPGDARIKSDYGSGWGPKKTILQKIAAILLNPVVITILTVSTISVLLYIFWYAYSPLYYEYVDSCVKANYSEIDDGKATGTMLYRNGYSSLFQFAASEGDKVAVQRTDEINVNRDVECSSQSFDDTVFFNAQVKRFNELLERIEIAFTKMDALKECLDLPAIDANFSETFSDAADDPVFTSTDNFTEPSTLAIYDCSVVQGCQAIRTVNDSDTECSGPGKNFLKLATHRAACSSENWFHAYLFATFMIIAVFIIINISRLIFMRGVVRVLWRIIVVRNFSFLGSCDDSGHLIYPERVTEKGDTMRVAIREALKKAIKHWERWGYVILVTGIIVNVPWIWGLVFLSKNLDYEP